MSDLDKQSVLSERSRAGVTYQVISRLARKLGLQQSNPYQF